MSTGFFKARAIERFGAIAWLTDDIDLYTTEEKAAVIDSASDWGAYLVDNAAFCGVEIHWLAEDQQLRHLGAAELPMDYRQPCPECGEPVHPDGICIVCEVREDG